VYLLTSSHAKGAHLRALFRLKGIELLRWSAFRGYPELQAERASESLRLGADYIRARFLRPFIIEDTEVRIEAYSRDSTMSYPGFDMKRWWKVTTFAEIDARCVQIGTRRASQSSNICLSIPGLKPYFFRATVKGEISNEPYDGPERPEAPWLNPREFGTIFIPQGASVPFAALPLDESFRFDFRKRAVDQVVAKIDEINTVLNLEASCYGIDDELLAVDSPQLALFNLDADNQAIELER
jgi:inosine/xanthosine triphosphate pyrophosphatase family protein